MRHVHHFTLRVTWYGLSEPFYDWPVERFPDQMSPIERKAARQRTINQDHAKNR